MSGSYDIETNLIVDICHLLEQRMPKGSYEPIMDKFRQLVNQYDIQLDAMRAEVSAERKALEIWKEAFTAGMIANRAAEISQQLK